MKHYYELAKYGRFWAVFDQETRCFDFIGAGKRFCEKKVKELNRFVYGL